MKLHTIFGLALFASLLTACGGGGDDDGGDPFAGVADFLHFTTIDNVSGPLSEIDHPLANDNPDAVLFATHNWNPLGGVGTYHDHPIGVRYETATGRWSVANQGAAPMPSGVYFNVTIISGFASAWTHGTEAGNLVLDRTLMDHPDLNGAPSALALVARNLTPVGPIAVSNANEVGLWYDSPRWSIYLQNPSVNMGDSLYFNVHALPGDGASFRHVAVASTVAGNRTLISHPDADNHPNAHVQVTHAFGTGVYNNRPVGVYYEDGSTNRWAIYNEDRTPMPEGVSYVVRVR